jgi:hypothetical protein
MGALWIVVVLLIVISIVLLLIAGVKMWKQGNNSHKRMRCGHRIPPINKKQCTDFCVKDVPESHGTSTIVLSCIDYRFIHAVVELIKDDEGVHFYDTFSLAGGSLGYNQTTYPSWPPTWLDTLTLAKQLHGIKQIIVVEHEDCGMYKAEYPSAVDPIQERILHQQNMEAFKVAMATLEPTLEVRGYLLYLDGTSERLV